MYTYCARHTIAPGVLVLNEDGTDATNGAQTVEQVQRNSVYRGTRSTKFFSNTNMIFSSFYTNKCKSVEILTISTNGNVNEKVNFPLSDLDGIMPWLTLAFLSHFVNSLKYSRYVIDDIFSSELECERNMKYRVDNRRKIQPALPRVHKLTGTTAVRPSAPTNPIPS